MSIISSNIKFLRKKLGLTQEQMSEKLGIKRSLLGAYEESRAEPALSIMQSYCSIFDITLESLINIEILKDADLEKLKRKDIEGKNLRVLSISVDKNDNENIHLVPNKASAGYLNGFADPEFVSELPHFNLPMFNQGSYRAFEIKGDSMLPLPSGTVIIGSFVENWSSVKDNKTYIIISDKEGIVYKRIINKIDTNHTLKLVSDNKVYEPYEIHVDDINEIWEAKAFISTEFPNPEVSLDALSSVVLNLQKELQELKKN